MQEAVTTKKKVRRREPNIRPRKSPKVWQVQRFYTLLCEIGMDEWISSAIELQNSKLAQNGSKPVKASDQVKGREAELTQDDFLQLSVHIDLGLVLKRLGQKDGFLEFVAIVMACTEEEAAELDMADFTENFTDFVLESLKVMGMLLGFGQGLG